MRNSKSKDSSVREIERPEWIPDESVNGCELCSTPFSFTQRRHHCRGCGHIFCKEHCNIMTTLPPEWGYDAPQRICSGCKIKFEKYAKTRLDRASDIESGVLIAQYYLRDKDFTYNAPLLSIGRRKPPLKNYFLVLPSSIGSGNEYVMTTIKSSTSLITTETTRQLFGSILRTVQHPFILPVDSVDYLLEKSTAVLIRPFSREGTLRDKLHKVDPRGDFYKKYGAQGSTPFSIKQVAICGRQILEALSFLQGLRFSYPHLNASNVVVKDGKCYLTDLENSFLGLPPLYIQHFTNDMTPELTCFGHVLFQMTMGFTKAKASIHEFAARLPKNVYDILCLIFAPTAPLTIAELLNNPFFSAVTITENVLEAKSQCVLEDKAKLLLRRIRRKDKEMIAQFIREQEEEAGTDIGSLRITEQETNKAAPVAASPAATNGSAEAAKSPQKAEPAAALSPKGPQPIQGYSSLNPSDPLNPDNRKKAAMRAKMLRKQSSLQRKSSTTKITTSSGTVPLTRTASSPAIPAQKTAPPPAPAPATPVKATTAAPKAPATTAAAAPPPPKAPAAPAAKAPAAPAAPAVGGPPPPPPPSVAIPAPQQGRAALLSSICDPSLGIGRLKKAPAPKKRR